MDLSKYHLGQPCSFLIERKGKLKPKIDYHKCIREHYGYFPPKELEDLEQEIIAESTKWIRCRDQASSNKIAYAHFLKDGVDPVVIDPVFSPYIKQHTKSCIESQVVVAGVIEDDSKKPSCSCPCPIDAVTNALAKPMEKLIKDHPIFPWIESTKGVSAKVFGELLFLASHPFLYPSPSKLYRRMGLHVDEGRAPKKRIGKFLGFDPRCKGWVFNLGVVIVRLPGSTYRRYYDHKKKQYASQQPIGRSACIFGQEHFAQNRIIPCTKRHVDMAARRYAVQKLVRDLWIAYHKSIESGLDVLNEQILHQRYGVVLDHHIAESRTKEIPKTPAVVELTPKAGKVAKAVKAARNLYGEA